MDIRPILTDADLDWALEEIEQYYDNEPMRGTPEADRFQILATLIEAYEDRHYPIDDADPIDVIRHVLDANGMKQSDLAEYVGTNARASEIMNRKRPLTLAMIRRISEGLHIPVGALTPAYPLAVDVAE